MRDMRDGCDQVKKKKKEKDLQNEREKKDQVRDDSEDEDKREIFVGCASSVNYHPFSFAGIIIMRLILCCHSSNNLTSSNTFCESLFQNSPISILFL
jgi:hypothetical protein